MAAHKGGTALSRTVLDPFRVRVEDPRDMDVGRRDSCFEKSFFRVLGQRDFCGSGLQARLWIGFSDVKAAD